MIQSKVFTQLLGAAFSQALETGKKFLTSLKEEQQNLEQNNMDAFNERIELSLNNKELALQDYRQACEKLFKLVNEDGQPMTLEGLDRTIAKLGDHRLIALHQAFGQQIQLIQELNKLNGILINTQLENVQGRLQALHRALNKDTPIYTSDGSTITRNMSIQRTVA